MKDLRSLAGMALLGLLAAVSARADTPTFGWSDIHDGGAGLNDDAVAVVFAADGHPIVGAVHDTGSGYTDRLIRKLDRQTGEPIWTFTYADPVGNDMALSELVLDHRGDLLVAGYLSACDS